MKKSKHIPSINEVLGALFHDMKIESRMEHVMLHKVWQQAVGEQIANNTAPANVRNGVLFVNVASSVWMQQLNFLRDQILEKLNARLSNKSQLKEIRFKIGVLPQSFSKVSAEPLPSLSEQEREQVAHETASISDPELRDIFQGVISAHLRNKKRHD